MLGKTAVTKMTCLLCPNVIKTILTGKPNFWIILAYFRAASRESPSLLAPVQTILPLLNISAVVLGSLIRIITAANLFGLYSAFLAWSAILFKSNLQFKFTVDTIFLWENKDEYVKKNFCKTYFKQISSLSNSL